MTERRIGLPQEHGRMPTEIWQRRYLPDWYTQAFFNGNVPDSPRLPEVLRNYGFFVSPRLQENPRAQLHLPTEISELQAQWTARYRTDVAHTVTTQVSEFDKQNPRISKLRGIGIMPVLATEDPAVFEKTLATYADQDMDPSEWRLLTYFNFFGVPTEEEREAVREKFKTVVKSQHDGVPIIAAFDAYPTAQPIGTIRTYAWDIAMEYLMRQGVNHDIVGISQDADAFARAKNYIRTFCEAAEQNPDKDIFTASHYWKPVGVPGSEEQKAMEYLEFLYELQRSEQKSAYTIDGNMALRISAYAAVGGYKADEMHETQLLTRHIEIGRGYTDGPMIAGTERTGLFLPDTFLRSDSRRQSACIARGISPHLAWEAVPFSTEYDAMRTTDVPKTKTSFDATRAAAEMELFLFDPQVTTISAHARELMANEKRKLGLAA